MKTKKEFINEVVSRCIGTVKDSILQEITTEKGKTFYFYIDKANGLVEIRHKGKYTDINTFSLRTAYNYAKDICEYYLGIDETDITDDRLNSLNKGISAWYNMTGDIIDNVKAWFKKNPDSVVEINIPNSMYFIIDLERKVVFKYIKEDKGQILVGVSEPVYHDDQIFDWYDHEIDFDTVLQDAITVADIMTEFYNNTK